MAHKHTVTLWALMLAFEEQGGKSEHLGSDPTSLCNLKELCITGPLTLSEPASGL